MDADMKSFLYSAAFYHPLSDFVPISFLFPYKSIFGKRFRFVTLKMAANKTVSTINFPLSPYLSVTANIGYAHSLNIFCKTLRLTHVFPFRKTLFQKHLFCNTLFNGIFMKFNKKCTLAHSLWNNKKRAAKTGFTLVCYSFRYYYISCFKKSQTKKSPVGNRNSGYWFTGRHFGNRHSHSPLQRLNI